MSSRRATSDVPAPTPAVDLGYDYEMRELHFQIGALLEQGELPEWVRGLHGISELLIGAQRGLSAEHVRVIVRMAQDIRAALNPEARGDGAWQLIDHSLLELAVLARQAARPSKETRDAIYRELSWLVETIRRTGTLRREGAVPLWR